MKFLLLFLAVIVSPVFAGTQTGKVETVIVRASDGLVYFTLSGGSKTGSPSCATVGYWMIRDENSNVGKQQYSMILTAHASGKTVTVVGANACSRWKDGEDVDYIQLRH